MLLFLKTHLIVGVGLPMVIEYFLQGTFKDHITNLKILFLILLWSCFINSQTIDVCKTCNFKTIKKAINIKLSMLPQIKKLKLNLLKISSLIFTKWKATKRMKNYLSQNH